MIFHCDVPFVFFCFPGAEAGYSLHEIMPSHLRLRALTDKCRSLTEAWHGQVAWRQHPVRTVTKILDFEANISYIYEMFMKMAERDGASIARVEETPAMQNRTGHSCYLFQDIPQQLGSSIDRCLFCSRTETHTHTHHSEKRIIPRFSSAREELASTTKRKQTLANLTMATQSTRRQLCLEVLLSHENNCDRSFGPYSGNHVMIQDLRNSERGKSTVPSTPANRRQLGWPHVEELFFC